MPHYAALFKGLKILKMFVYLCKSFCCEYFYILNKGEIFSYKINAWQMVSKCITFIIRQIRYIYGMIKRIIFLLLILCSCFVAPIGAQYTILHSFNGADGAWPDEGNIILSSQILYGTVTEGGHDDNGCIFSVDTDGSNYKVLQFFNDTTNGTASLGVKSFRE